MDREGVAFGPVVLVEKIVERGEARYRRRPLSELEKALSLAYGRCSAEELSRTLTGLDQAAEALGQGKLIRAGVAAIRMRLPPLSEEAMAKLARTPGFRRVAVAKVFNPGEPRLPVHVTGGGEWTGGAGGTNAVVPAAHKPATIAPANQGKTWKQAWVGQPHEAMRQKIAEWEHSANASPGSYGYQTRNSNTNALGRYQFLKAALIDIGVKNMNGSWRTDTDFYRAYHIDSDQQFLNNEAAQEYAMTAYLARLQQETKSLLQQYGGKTFTGLDGLPIIINQAGLTAAAHRVGSDDVRKYLNRFGGADTKGKETQMNETKYYRWVETRLREGQYIPY